MQCRFTTLFWVALVGLTIALARGSNAGEAGSPGQVNYARPFEPPTRPAFMPLPPGAVEPAGWLRDWCLAAKDGYTGHMDEYDDEFKRAWSADHKMTGEGLLWYKGAWPYEGGGYWFDGLVRLGFALHDEALIQQATKRLYAVADHMNSDGILFLWWLNKNNPADRNAVTAALDGWPLWACGLLGRAMTGYYAGSGDTHILGALEKAYGGDPDGLRWITGNMSNPWPAFDTYSWTGNQAIADALNAVFDKSRPGLKPHLDRYRLAPDLTPGTTVENQHVVEFIECTTPWLVGYLWTGDTGYLRAAVGWHDLLERIAMQPHGVPVSDEWYVPTGAFRGSETCDVAGYVWSQTALLAVTGEGRMADRAERAFFNAGAATVSRDFKTHVYFQSPNRFAARSPDFPHGPRAGGGCYQPKHAPLCCTAALNRIVPYYVTHMWMATYDNGLAATCYGPCKVTALVADRVPVEITCKTDYPFNDTIEVSVTPAREATFPLLFHIPGWCVSPELSVNGSAVKVEPNAKGFACVGRSWKPGDTVWSAFSDDGGREDGARQRPGRTLYGRTQAHYRDNTRRRHHSRLAIRLGLLRTIALRARHSGHPGCEHPRRFRALEIRTECPASGHHRGAPYDASPLGLAAGVSSETHGQRRRDRLGTCFRGAQVAGSADCQTESVGEDHAHPVWLHEVQDLHVSCHRGHRSHSLCHSQDPVPGKQHHVTRTQ